MHWGDVANVVVGGLVLLIIKKSAFAWNVVRLPFRRKRIYSMEWICFTSMPIWQYVLSGRYRLPEMDVSHTEEWRYALMEDDFLIPVVGEDIYCVPTEMADEIYPGGYQVVTPLQVYESIRLYDRNPLYMKAGAQRGFRFVEWRNKRLIERFYRNVSDELHVELCARAEFLRNEQNERQDSILRP